MSRKKFNTYPKQKERAIKRKYELIQHFGGKCEICGYNKNIAALEFHHKNPDDKSFKLDSRTLASIKEETIIEEASKCMLLCSTCHREIHNQDLNMEDIKQKIAQYNEEQSKKHKNGLIIQEPKKIKCKRCGKEFEYSRGKKYCSVECRRGKEYPSYDEIIDKYNELKKWTLVYEYFNLSKKIINNIRNRH